MARSTLYRRRQPVTPKPKRRPRPHRALDETEREEVLGALHCERFVDKAPAQVWATLLDEGTYLCSIRTMYRILEEHGEVRERRNQRRHPNYTKPELLAEAPNQVWSWDITKLRGPVKWTYYYLYVILDIFSRYVVGWMLAHRESSLWSSRTAHHRSAPDPSRSSTGSSRTLRSRNAATARFASAGLDQPAAGKNDPPRCRTSPSRGGVHTWGTSFFCFTQRDLDRC